MTRLAGIDANFLYAETRSTLMHTLKIAVVDVPARLEGAELFTRFRRELAARLHRLPRFRQRAQPVPFGLHFPVWVDDPAFDLQRHTFRRRLAPGAGQAEADRVIAELVATPLRRDRPLWEIWMLDRLADGGVVFVGKLHHALADGLASSQMLSALMATDRASSLQTDPGAPRWSPEPLPRRRRLVAQALRETPERARRFLPLLKRTAIDRAQALRAHRRADRSVPKAFQADSTAFNRALPSTRSFSTTRLELDRVRAIKRAAGVSLNDVVLALAASATASYLHDMGGLPSRPLLASVPIGVQSPDRATGNHLSNVITSLRTEVRGPLERLRAISGTTRAAMAIHDHVGNDSMGEWAEFTPGRAFKAAMGLYSRLRLASRHRPPVNLIVSNVRGPGEPLWIAGVRLRRLYSVGPILDGIGLNLTVWSYAGELSFAALSHGELPRELSVLTGRLHDALDDLERAVASPQSGAGWANMARRWQQGDPTTSQREATRRSERS